MTGRRCVPPIPVTPDPAGDGHRVDALVRSLIREDIYTALHGLHLEPRWRISQRFEELVATWRRLDGLADEVEASVAELPWPDEGQVAA